MKAEDRKRERKRLREAGRRAAQELPSISPESARRVADAVREPLNEYVAERRKANEKEVQSHDNA
jgi:hypothetical protein